MVQSEVTPPIVAGVCDPGVPRTTGLTEASYNEKPACYPKTAAFEPCRAVRPLLSAGVVGLSGKVVGPREGRPRCSRF
jgi:hypothetical protein